MLGGGRLVSDVATTGGWGVSVDALGAKAVMTCPVVVEKVVAGVLLLVVAEAEAGAGGAGVVSGVAMARGEADNCVFSRSRRMRSRSFSRSFATDSTYTLISEATLSTFEDLDSVRLRKARRDSDVGDKHIRREIGRPISIEVVGVVGLLSSGKEVKAAGIKRGGGGEGCNWDGRSGRSGRGLRA
jgi:hypothetical protein